MSVELNHTIVHVRDRWAAARDVGGVLGLPDAQAYGPFAELKLDNGASLKPSSASSSTARCSHDLRRATHGHAADREVRNCRCEDVPNSHARAPSKWR